MHHRQGNGQSLPLSAGKVLHQGPFLLLQVKGFQQRIEGLGFAGYLSKPVRTRDLLDCINGQISSGASTSRAEMRSERAPQTPAAADIEHARRVLVVEDNAVNQKIAQRFLERLGCNVVLANNGAEGVELLGSERYDLVLMDLQMPEMDGLEATRNIRAAAREIPLLKRIPIVAMTANAMKADLDACIEAGMNGWVTKPIDKVALKAELEKALIRT